ncbi:MAG: hypothetical protein ABI969_10555 [bacterium]
MRASTNDSEATIAISRDRLVNLLGSYPSLPSSDDDDTPDVPWPARHGLGPTSGNSVPWRFALDDFARGPSPEPWRAGLERVALNPQLLPPQALVASAISGILIEHARRVAELVSVLPELEHGLGGQLDRELTTTIDDCGTMMAWDLVQSILARLTGRVPATLPPPPRPNWGEKLGSTDLLTIGARLAYVAADFRSQAVSSALKNAGHLFMDRGLQR